MFARLYFSILALALISRMVDPRVVRLWLGDGTTPNLQEVIIGRCYNYIRVVNPSIGERNCTAIWNAFREAFIYRNACSVLPSDYQTFIFLASHQVPPNKALFWEKTKRLVHRYSDTTRRMMPLGDTLIGWLGDDLTWCGSSSGDGLDYMSCPTTAECEHNPVESFWRIASTTYASLSSGVIQVMLNGSVSDGAYPENRGETLPSTTESVPCEIGIRLVLFPSFFAKFELPYLRKDNISEVQIWVMDEVGGPDVESCGTESVGVLQRILKEEGFNHTCTDNYRAVRILQCVDSPSHPACLCPSAASTLQLLDLHLLTILLSFLF